MRRHLDLLPTVADLLPRSVCELGTDKASSIGASLNAHYVELTGASDRVLLEAFAAYSTGVSALPGPYLSSFVTPSAEHNEPNEIGLGAKELKLWYYDVVEKHLKMPLRGDQGPTLALLVRLYDEKYDLFPFLVPLFNSSVRMVVSPSTS